MPGMAVAEACQCVACRGYHVNLIQLTGADHYAPVFHEMHNGQFQVSTNDKAGQRAVQVILDAIATRQLAMSNQ